MYISTSSVHFKEFNGRTLLLITIEPFKMYSILNLDKSSQALNLFLIFFFNLYVILDADISVYRYNHFHFLT